MAAHTAIIGYIRGKYNAFTPYNRWHRVQSVEREHYVTACGLRYYPEDVGNEVNTYQQSRDMRGDRCLMLACTPFS